MDGIPERSRSEEPERGLAHFGAASRIGRPVVCLGIVLGILAGCGYSMRSLTYEGVHTVAVEMIENPTFRRDLEFELTQELKVAILSRTQLRIAEPGNADLLLKGKIVDVREQVLAENPIGDVVESSIIITVVFTTVDPRTGAEIRTRRIRDRVDFVVGRTKNVNPATVRAFQDISEHAVYAMLEEGF